MPYQSCEEPDDIKEAAPYGAPSLTMAQTHTTPAHRFS